MAGACTVNAIVLCMNRPENLDVGWVLQSLVVQITHMLQGGATPVFGTLRAKKE